MCRISGKGVEERGQVGYQQEGARVRAFRAKVCGERVCMDGWKEPVRGGHRRHECLSGCAIPECVYYPAGVCACVCYPAGGRKGWQRCWNLLATVCMCLLCVNICVCVHRGASM